MGKQKQTSMDNMIPFVDFMPDPLAPVPLERWPRRPEQTDEQYAAGWEMNKRTHRRWVVALSAFQAMATIYGYHKTCKNPQCRRKHRCTGIRLPDSKDDYPVPLFPLCGTIDMAERARRGVVEMSRIVNTTIVQWLPQTAAYIRVRKC
jgi:hypothetical protein